MEELRKTGQADWQAADEATAKRIKQGWLRLDLILDVVQRAWQGKVPDPREAVESAVIAAVQADEIPLYVDDECTIRAKLPADEPLSHIAKLHDVQRWFGLNSQWPLGALNYPSLLNAKWPPYPAPSEPRQLAGRRLWRLSEAVEAIATMPNFGISPDVLLKMASKATTEGQLTARDPQGGAPRQRDRMTGFLVEWVFAEDFNAWLEAAGYSEQYRLTAVSPEASRHAMEPRQHVVLWRDTISVPYKDVPVLIADALHPVMKHDTLAARMLRVDAEERHRKELRRAADIGDVPLIDHAGLPTTPGDHAFLRVDDLKTYLSRFNIGLGLRSGGAGARPLGPSERRPEPWPPADWETWAYKRRATLRGAVLLSLGLQPMRRDGHDYADPGKEAERRIAIAVDYLGEEGPLRPLDRRQLLGARENVELDLAEFRSWAEGMGWGIPDRFPAAKPVSVAKAAVEAVGAPPDTWHGPAREKAQAFIRSQAQRDLYPSQEDIAEEVAKQFRTEGVMGGDGKPLSAGTIKRHALKGITSAQKKARATHINRGK